MCFTYNERAALSSLLAPGEADSDSDTEEANPASQGSEEISDTRCDFSQVWTGFSIWKDLDLFLEEASKDKEKDARDL